VTLGELRAKTASLPDDTKVFVWGREEPPEDMIEGAEAWLSWCGGLVTSCDVVQEGEDPAPHVELYAE